MINELERIRKEVVNTCRERWEDHVDRISAEYSLELQTYRRKVKNNKN
jgi:hypothetical protein